MKRKLLTLGLVMLLLVSLVPCFAFAQEEAQTASIVFGGRLQSDMLFYMQAGVIVDTWEAVAGLGLNNSIWLGAHKYIAATDEISVFSGVELHVTYPRNDTLTFKPALPIGFAFDTRGAVFVIESLIMPSLTGAPIEVLFAVSFLFKL